MLARIVGCLPSSADETVAVNDQVNVDVDEDEDAGYALRAGTQR